jgi:hypothetical protein
LHQEALVRVLVDLLITTLMEMHVQVEMPQMVLDQVAAAAEQAITNLEEVTEVMEWW